MKIGNARNRHEWPAITASETAIVFDPDDVDKLRRHDLPLVCGIYPKKSCRQFACAFQLRARRALEAGRD